MTDIINHVYIKRNHLDVYMCLKIFKQLLEEMTYLLKLNLTFRKVLLACAVSQFNESNIFNNKFVRVY